MNSNEQKFATLVKENKSTIYTMCYMFSNDEDEVADLFQEVLIRLWKGIDSFDGRSDIKTWIYRVALNTCGTIDKKKQLRSYIKSNKLKWSRQEDLTQILRKLKEIM